LKKILVTGACGYLGARLSQYLAKEGHSITAFDTYDASSAHVQWSSLMDDVIIGDIRDESTINNLIKKNFEVVIHLISLDHHKSENDPNFVSSINVMPTWNLLENFTKGGLEKFIYFSTIHVYGNLPIEIINEDYPPQPINTYGLTHLMSENICNYYNDKTETDCINVRLSNSYGSPVFRENNCWWLVINDLCKTAIENSKIRLQSNGSPQRDFIHGDDVAEAINILIQSEKNINSNTFHIASGETLTILELAHWVKSIYTKLYNKGIDIVLPDNSISENSEILPNVKKYTISTDRIHEIGFQCQTDLDSGISELFNYFMNN